MTAKHRVLSDEERALIRALAGSGMRQAEIARREGLAESTVSRVVRNVDRSAPAEPVLSRRLVERRCLQQQMTMPEMARALRVSEALARQSLRRYGLPLIPVERLRKEYVDQQVTLEDIADQVHCSLRMIQKYMIKAGIPRRPRGRQPRPAETTLSRVTS